MKKRMLGLVLLAVMLVASSIPPAASAAMYVLTKTDTSIYTPASSTGPAMRTPIPARTNVKVIEEMDLRVRVSWQGVNGFIAREDLLMPDAAAPGEPVEPAPSVQESRFIELNKDAELFVKTTGTFEKIGRLLTGELFQTTGRDGAYAAIVFAGKTAYVKETDVAYLDSAILPGGVQPGAAYEQTAITRKTADLLYNKNGSLIALGRLQSGTRVTTRAVYRDYYIVDAGGRTAYIKKADVTLYTGNYVDPFRTITYSQMVQDLKELSLWHEDLLSLEVIGKSVDGRDIHAVKLGTGKEEIIINASHHAREHLTTNVVMEMIDQYAHLAKTNGSMNGYNVQALLKKTSIYFVPMVNPDGVSLVQLGPSSAKNKAAAIRLNGGSSNFTAWKANVRGVDLNRNYPADWANICCDPGKPSSQNYKGPAPLSEPEAKAMTAFVGKHSFKASVSYHSSGQIIFWNFHQPSTRKARDYAIARKVSQKTGYSLVMPKSAPSGGGFNDWFLITEKMPGFTIEISPYVGNRPVPIVYFSSIWKQNNTIGLMMADL